MNVYRKFIMVGCPLSGRVVLRVKEHNWHTFSIAHFLYTNHTFSLSLITFFNFHIIPP